MFPLIASSAFALADTNGCFDGWPLQGMFSSNLPNKHASSAATSLSFATIMSSASQRDPVAHSNTQACSISSTMTFVINTQGPGPFVSSILHIECTELNPLLADIQYQSERHFTS
jgi:hypothetical protein